ncbi:MAG: Shedu anti-phage system protein SduA domain-containing protein [Chloroflexota bacterium]
MAGDLPKTIEDVKVEIRTTNSNPNVGKTYQVILKEGPKIYRIATIFEIFDANAGKLHHHALKVDSYRSTRQGFEFQPNESRWIVKEPGELNKLGIFIRKVIEAQFPQEDGSYHIIDDDSFAKLENLVPLVSRADLLDRLHLLETIITDISAMSVTTSELTQTGEELLKNIAVASRMVQYRRVYEEFRQMVHLAVSNEYDVQRLLSANPWLFGSEYSELLERRTWTRDDRLDFMLRRTVDGYLEIVEIKTPFTDPLMRYDKSHDSYYPSSTLSQVLGQVVRYIDEIDRHGEYIRAEDRYDPLKIRARVIIGRDGNEEHQKALRNLNAHLHRIEIITFDQLLKIGQRVLGVFEDAIPDAPPDIAPGEGDIMSCEAS